MWKPVCFGVNKMKSRYRKKTNRQINTEIVDKFLEPYSVNDDKANTLLAKEWNIC